MTNFRPSRNEVFAVLFRISQIFAWLVSGRIILTSMGSDDYGFVFVMLSLSAWLQMFDFGITSFIRTELPRARARGGTEDASSLFKNALMSTTMTGVVIILSMGFFLLFLPRVSQYFIGLLSSNGLIGVRDFDLVVLTLSSYSLLLIIGNLFQAFLAAFNRQYLYYAFGFLGFALQPVGVWLMSSRKSGLVELFFVFCLVPVAPVTTYLFWTFLRSLSRVARARGNNLLNRTSTSYVIIQLTGALVGNLDLLLVSHFFGLKEAAVYSAFKLIIQVPISLHAQFNIQSWPVYTLLSQTPSRSDELRRLVLRNSGIALAIAAVLVVGLSMGGPWLIAVWSRDTLSATHMVAFLFSVYGAAFIVSNTLAVVMFSHGHTQSMLPVSLFGPPIFVLLVWLMRDIGIAAVVLGNLVATVMGLVVGVIFFFRHIGIELVSPDERDPM